jgi:transcriptional regulator with XRE-family HTH domain
MLGVKLLLVVTGTTQQELAEAVGVSRVTIWHWLSGRSQPNRAAGEKIAKFLAERLLFNIHTADQDVEKKAA